MATAQRSVRTINAVVVSAGLMQKTVKVRVGAQQWNKKVEKFYNRRSHLLVHDPNSSLHTGDIISIQAGFRASKTVRHVVHSIIAPFGPTIAERPPVLTLEERAKAELAKTHRKNLRDGGYRHAGCSKEKWLGLSVEARDKALKMYTLTPEQKHLIWKRGVEEAERKAAKREKIAAKRKAEDETRDDTVSRLQKNVSE